MDDPSAGDAGFVMAFHHEQTHAVGEFLFNDRNLLRVQRRGGGEQKDENE
jgi:hypothetical protein